MIITGAEAGKMHIDNGFAAKHIKKLEKAGETEGGRKPFELIKDEENKCPYSHLAKNGIISYNGVQFMCDSEKNRLCLGDVSNPKDCITVPLSGGGSLVVNRKNIGDLSHAIGMFSPEDTRRILCAITTDTKVQQALFEIEDEKNSIGENILSFPIFSST